MNVAVDRYCEDHTQRPSPGQGCRGFDGGPDLAALYAALAQSLRCPLVTTDGRLARTATTQFGLTVTHVPTSGR